MPMPRIEASELPPALYCVDTCARRMSNPSTLLSLAALSIRPDRLESVLSMAAFASDSFL